LGTRKEITNAQRTHMRRAATMAVATAPQSVWTETR